MSNLNQINQFLSEMKDRTLMYLCYAFPALSGDDIEDVYQDASIAFYLNICNGKLGSMNSSLYTYFLRICINQSLKMLKKKEQIQTLVIGDGGTGVKSVSYDVVEKAMMSYDDAETRRKEERKQHLVKILIGEMSDQCRNLLLGHYVEGQSWQVIAQQCGLANADTAKSIACRCRKKFKDKFMSLACRIEEVGEASII